MTSDDITWHQMTSCDITELARYIYIPDLLPDEIMAEKTPNLSICNRPAQHSGMTTHSETITPIAALSTTHSTLTSLPKDLPSPEASSLPDCPGMSRSTACSRRQETVQRRQKHAEQQPQRMRGSQWPQCTPHWRQSHTGGSGQQNIMESFGWQMATTNGKWQMCISISQQLQVGVLTCWNIWHLATEVAACDHYLMSHTSINTFKRHSFKMMACAHFPSTAGKYV